MPVTPAMSGKDDVYKASLVSAKRKTPPPKAGVYQSVQTQQTNPWAALKADYYTNAYKYAQQEYERTGTLVDVDDFVHKAMVATYEKVSASPKTAPKYFDFGTIDNKKKRESIFKETLKYMDVQPKAVVGDVKVTKVDEGTYDPETMQKVVTVVDRHGQPMQVYEKDLKKKNNEYYLPGQLTGGTYYDMKQSGELDSAIAAIMKLADRQKKSVKQVADEPSAVEAPVVGTPVPEQPPMVQPTAKPPITEGFLGRLTQMSDEIKSVENIIKNFAPIAGARANLPTEQAQTDPTQAGFSNIQGRQVYTPEVPQLPQPLTNSFDSLIRGVGKGTSDLGRAIVRGLSAYRGKGALYDWAYGEEQERPEDFKSWSPTSQWLYSFAEKANSSVGELLGSLPYYVLGYGVLGKVVGVFGPTATLGLSQRTIKQAALEASIPTANSAVGRIFQRGITQAGETAARIGMLSTIKQASVEGVNPDAPLENISKAASEGMVAGAILGFVFGSIVQAYPEIKFAIQSLRAGKRITLASNMSSRSFQNEVERLTREGWELRKNGVLYKPPILGPNGEIIETAQTGTITLQYKGKSISLTGMIRQYGGVPPDATVIGAPGAARPPTAPIPPVTPPVAPTVTPPVAPVQTAVPQLPVKPLVTPTAPPTTANLPAIVGYKSLPAIEKALVATNKTDPAQAWELKRQVVEAQALAKANNGNVDPDIIDPALAKALNQMPDISLDYWVSSVKRPTESVSVPEKPIPRQAPAPVVESPTEATRLDEGNTVDERVPTERYLAAGGDERLKALEEQMIREAQQSPAKQTGPVPVTTGEEPVIRVTEVPGKAAEPEASVGGRNVQEYNDIVTALSGGANVHVRTQQRLIKLSNPEQLRRVDSGELQFRSGNKWFWLTQAQVNQMAEEAEQAIPAKTAEKPAPARERGIADDFASRMVTETGREADRSVFRELGNNLINAINTNDYEYIIDHVHIGNPNSMKLFGELTGVNVKSNAAVKRHLEKQPGYSEWAKSQKEASVKVGAAKTAETRQQAIKDKMAERTSFKGKAMTFEEFIDNAIADGATVLRDGKRGAIKTVELYNPESKVYLTFTNAAEKEIVRGKVAKAITEGAPLPAAKKEATITPPKPFKGRKSTIAILKSNLPKKTTMPLLKNIVVKDGVAYAVDLSDADIMVAASTDLPDGAYAPVGKELQPVAIEGDLSDYPDPFPMGDEKGSTVWKYSDIVVPLKRAAAFTSRVETRPAFNGILLKVEKDAGQIISSDTYRLTQSPINAKGIEDGEYLLPRKAVELLLSDANPQDIHISMYADTVIFDTGNIKVTAQLLQEKYPAVAGVFPKKVERVAMFDRDEIESAVQKIRELKPSGSFQAVAFTETPTGFTTHFQSDVTNKSHTINIPATFYKGGQLNTSDLALVLPIRKLDEVAITRDFSLNAKYVEDIVKGYTGKKIYMGWGGSAPLVFKDSPVIAGRLEPAASPAEGKTETLGHTAPLSAAAPAPLTGKVRGSTNKILSLIDEIMPRYRGKFRFGDRAGVYRQKTPGIDPEGYAVMHKSYARNVKVNAHELGHHLDVVAGLNDPSFHGELTSIPYVQGLMLTRKRWSKEKFRKEGIAEFVAMYVMDNPAAQTAMPTFYAHFERQLFTEHPAVYEKLQTMRNMWEDLQRSTSVEGIIDEFMGSDLGQRTPYEVIVEKLSDWRDPVHGVWAQLVTNLADAFHPAVATMGEITGVPFDKTHVHAVIRLGQSDGWLETFLNYGQFTDANNYTLYPEAVGGNTSYPREEAEKLYAKLYKDRWQVTISEDPQAPGKWTVKATPAFDEAKFSKSGPCLAEIVGAVRKLGTDARAADEHQAQWTRYMVAKHAIEMEEAGLVSGTLSAERGVMLQSLKDFAASVEASPYAQVYEDQTMALLGLRDYALDLLADSGIISKTVAKGQSKSELDLIKDKWKYHIPFHHIEGKSSKGSARGTIGSPVKALRGGEKQIMNPIEAIMKEAYVYHRIANMHNIRKAFIEEAGNNPMMAANFFRKVDMPQGMTALKAEDVYKQLQGLVELSGGSLKLRNIDFNDTVMKFFRPTMVKGGDYFYIYKDGKPVAYEVKDKALLEALDQTNQESATWLGRLGHKMATVFRMGHITNPVFPKRNVDRDALIATGYSESGFIPYVTFMDGVMGFVFDTPKARKIIEKFGAQLDMTGPGRMLNSYAKMHRDDVLLYKFFGGTMRSPDVFNENALNNMMEKFGMETTKGHLYRAWSGPINPWQWLKSMATMSEMSTNLGETLKGIKKGFDPRKAALFGRETTVDHQMIGARSRVARDWIPFLNPRIQGWSRLWRQMRDPERRHKTLLKWVLGITLPSIYHYSLVKDNPHWQESDRAYRDAWMLWPIGDPKTTDMFMPIPRAHSIVGFVFGALPARMAEYLHAEDKEAFDKWEEGFWRAVNPSMTIWIAQLINDLKVNHRSFSGIPIEGYADLNKPPGERSGLYTSEIAKLLGGATNVSPKKIDYATDTAFGALGRTVSAPINAGLRMAGIGDSATKPEATIADIPVIGELFRRSGAYGANSIQALYDMKDKATQIKNSKKYPEGYGEAEWHLVEVELPKINKALGELTAINKEIAMIQDSDMSPAEKRKVLDHLDKVKINIARMYFGKELIK